MAVQLCSELFGRRVEIVKQFPSFDDENWFVRDVDSQELFVLKILKKTSRESLHFQETVRSALASKGVAVPVTVPSPTGETTLQHGDFLVQLVTYLHGDLYVHQNRTDKLISNFGGFLARCSKALLDLNAECDVDHDWDMKNARRTFDKLAPQVKQLLSPEKFELLNHFMEMYSAVYIPRSDKLRVSMMHGDANDYNVLVENEDISGLIDFGDVCKSHMINEFTIAIAYALLDQSDPMTALTIATAGYAHHLELNDDEIAVIFPCACARLVISISMSTVEKTVNPDNTEYLNVTAPRAWPVLAAMREIPFEEAFHRLRLAHRLGVAARKGEQLSAYLQSHPPSHALHELPTEAAVFLDLSKESEMLKGIDTADPDAFSSVVQAVVKDAPIAYGKYNETRALYTSDQFLDWFHLPRVVHIGVDIFCPEGSRIFCPIDGTVHSFKDNRLPLDYGPCIILQHEADGLVFYSLYGHLSRESLEGLHTGKKFAAGDALAKIGAKTENGGWPTHLHFQVMTDMFDMEGDFPGVCSKRMREAFLKAVVDPSPFVRCNVNAGEN